MNILNRYVLKKFIVPFLAAFAALLVLALVSELFDSLDRFLADGVNKKDVLVYLLTYLPYEGMQILPISCLLATLFVVGNLARTKEYVAGLAGGLPPERFLSGLLWAGLAISFIALAANETFVPATKMTSRRVFREDIRHLGEWRQKDYHDLFVNGLDGRIWTAKLFSIDQGEMIRVVVDTFRGGLLGGQIDAESAEFTAEGWIFRNGVVRSFSPDDNTVTLSTPFQEKIFAFKEKPSDLATQEPQPEEMNYSTLRRHIRRLHSLGIPVRKLEVELMMKLAFPLSCLIVIFLGIPLAMRGKGSHAMGIAAGGAITLLYMGFVEFGKALGQNILPPLVGAWLGNIVFGAIALVLWRRMRQTA